MLLEKPTWVNHINATGSKCAIYSVDVHPGGDKFATAGGDNTVKIWSLPPLLEPEVENDDSKPKLLATLSWHQQAVNCVRWSCDGSYLVSGSDDHFVMVYELQKGKPAAVPFGSNAAPNVENWARVSTFKGHTMDVQDVAWSPDDRMLATCSIDNKILIWLIEKGDLATIVTQPYQTLLGHTGWVKGLTWDPVGKYLASSGEDKSVILWRTQDWKIEKKIEDPFLKSTSTSHFRRVSWSPDGSTLCGTHAFKSKKEVAALIDRSLWSNEVDLVGHKGVITTAQFNPRLLVKESDDKSSLNCKEYSCCAIGGKDCTISVWLTQVARPLAIVKECFDACVTDMSWSRNGYILLSCSLDGSLCCFKFEPSEIGIPIPEDDQRRLLQQKYGFSAGATTSSVFVEDPSHLDFEESPVQKQTTVASPGFLSKRLAAAPPRNVIPLPTQQKSGKRRITSVLINTTSLSSATKSPTLDSNVEVPVTTSSAMGEVSTKALTPASTSTPTSTPTLALASSSIVPSELTDSSPARLGESTPSSPSLPPLRSSDRPLAAKRAKRAVASGTTLLTATASTTPALAPAPVSALALGSKQDLAAVAVAPSMQDDGMHGRLLPVPTPKVRFTFVPTRTDRGASSMMQVECRVHNINVVHENGLDVVETKGPVFTTVSCTQSGMTLWTDKLPGRFTCGTGNDHFTCLGSFEGSLIILSETGCRMLPPMVLGHPHVILECSPGKGAYLMAILTDGSLKIWNILKKKVILSTTILPIISGFANDGCDVKNTNLVRSRVTNKGQPLITFAVSSCLGSKHLRSFAYDNDMGCWMALADESFSFSDFETMLPVENMLAKDIPSGPLKRLQSASSLTGRSRNLAIEMLSGLTDKGVQKSVTRSHIEHQIASSLVLHSPVEYEHWLRTYARHLTAEGDVIRLQELCSKLLGPPSTRNSAVKSTEWDPRVLGMSKRQLLKSIVLPIVAKNRSLQRLVNQFQRDLSEIEDGGSNLSLEDVEN